MPDFAKGRSARAVTRPRPVGARPGWRGLFWPLIFAALLLLGGGEALVVGLVRAQDAARLAAAPVCAAGQAADCRLDEQVTVLAVTLESAGRAGSVHVVHVQTPDGHTQAVYASDHDAGLRDRLAAGTQVNAELWNGFVVRMDDGAGHYLLADDSPAVTAILFPLIGLGAVAAGGFLLAFCVRRLRRP